MSQIQTDKQRRTGSYSRTKCNEVQKDRLKLWRQTNPWGHLAGRGRGSELSLGWNLMVPLCWTCLAGPGYWGPLRETGLISLAPSSSIIDIRVWCHLDSANNRVDFGHIHLLQNGPRVNKNITAFICFKIRTGYLMLHHHVWPFNPTVSYSVCTSLGNLTNEVLYISVKTLITLLHKRHTLLPITTQIWSNWRNHLMFFKTPHAWTFCLAELKRWAISPVGCSLLKKMFLSLLKMGRHDRWVSAPWVINVAFPPLFMTHQTFTGLAWILTQIENIIEPVLLFVGNSVNNNLFFTLYWFFIFKMHPLFKYVSPIEIKDLF